MIRSFLLVCIISLAMNANQLYASHIAGGEITWRCMPGGEFKFQMRLYRDCNGIPGPTSGTLNTTVPGVPTIFMSLISQMDISQAGFQNDGTTPCVNCSSGGSLPANPGLIEESVYESVPITLSGTPPPTGWTFMYSDCCRNDLVDNITGTGALGMGFRAVMFPYQGMAATPCADNSPYFAEKPMLMNCTGLPFKYNNLAQDAEQDSLVYQWTNPIDDFGTPFPWAPGYSTSSQLPSPTQNPNNVGVTLNTATGEIAFTSFTGGLFTTAIKVSAWKCGIKVAEIYRDVNVVLNNNCPPILGGVSNAPPLVDAPFINQGTGLQTEYIDTVFAGDTVHFDIDFTDFDVFNDGSLEQLYVDATGTLFGTGFTSSSQGCPFPPCATLSIPPPYITQAGGTVTFDWVTDCNHVIGGSPGCPDNRYNFVIKVSDNYCPSNGRNISTISILVVPRPAITEGAEIRCASVNADSSVTLSWLPPVGGDPNNSFTSYTILASTSYNGNYQTVTNLATGFGTNSYVHTKGDQFALFNTTAAQQPLYYRIIVESACGMFGYASNIRQSIHCNAVLDAQNQATLNWDPPSVSMPGTFASQYRVFREYPQNTWTLVDSTSSTSFTDPFTQGLCNAIVGYRVEITDSSGCTVVSSVDTVLVNSPASLATITPANPAFCPGQSVLITAAFGQSYLWNTGATTQSISVNTLGTYSVTVTAPGGCTGQGSVSVVAFAVPSASMSGNATICQGQSTTITISITGTPPFTYSFYDGNTTYGPFNTVISPIVIIVNPTVSTTYTPVMVADAYCQGTVSGMAIITVIPTPTPIITANGPTSFCAGDSVQLNPTGGFASYLWYRNFGPVSPQPVTSWYYAKTRGNYYCMVTDVNGCSGTSNGINVYVPCVPIGPAQQKDLDDDESGTQSGIMVFPNPSNDVFTVVLTGTALSEKAVITLFDATGKRILLSQEFDKDGMFQIRDLNPGIYLLHVQSGNMNEIRKLIRLE